MSDYENLICFSQRRWERGLERSRQQLARAARERNVFFVEEPIFDREQLQLEIEFTDQGVIVMRPFVPAGTDEQLAHAQAQAILIEFMRLARITEFDVITDDQLELAAAA